MESSEVEPVNTEIDEQSSERKNRKRRRPREFWHRITAGLELQELWTLFKRDTQESYSTYSREVDWQSVNKRKGVGRTVAGGRALFMALFMKLTPARRVFLLLALVFVFLAIVKADSGGFPSGPWNLLSAGALLLLIALELSDRVAMKRDLEIARDIQNWLVPDDPPAVPGLDIAFTTRPANTVAGDYYDAFLRESNDDSSGSSRMFLVVADVAGKSVPAAMLMATFQASLRTLAASPISLREITDGLNRYACAHSLNGRRFTTAFLAELDLADNSLTYVTAGHNAPVLRRAAGEVERLDIGGVPLGVQEDWPYEFATTRLAQDDLLVIFSDGVSEAVNEQNVEYGEPRLVELLRMAPREDASKSLERILRDVDSFVGDTRQQDDITCLILRKL